MATFDIEQHATLRIVLGYASVPMLLTTQLVDDRAQATIDRAIALVDELTDIDTKLTAARADSMAVGVGKLQLSYSQHVRHLKSEGDRLLHELEALLGIEVIYNKYKGAGLTTKAYW
jgi:hypothetical protein